MARTLQAANRRGWDHSQRERRGPLQRLEPWARLALDLGIHPTSNPLGWLPSIPLGFNRTERGPRSVNIYAAALEQVDALCRRSRSYETPVVAVEHDGSVYVALPYGEGT